MTILAFALVMTSALTHATWNFLAKRVSGDITFVWLFNTIGTLVYFPLAVVVFVTQRPIIGAQQLVFLVVSTLLHLVYYFLLTRGYRVGDLSLVYPLARGSGPLLSTLGAILLLAERPPPLVVAGSLLIGFGIFIIAGNPFSVRRSNAVPAIIYGLLTGLAVATYTLWDKQAVSVMGIPPLILTWFGTMSLAAVVTPYTWRYRHQVRAIWRDFRREAIGIGVLDSLGYILFLIALSLDSTSNPVSNLAPLRQVSILIGAFLGARALSEGESRRRLTAALVIVAGVALLTFQ
jgi:drug/metabolite transporter (DMT)-like permease